MSGRSARMGVGVPVRISAQSCGERVGVEGLLAGEQLVEETPSAQMSVRWSTPRVGCICSGDM